MVGLGALVATWPMKADEKWPLLPGIYALDVEDRVKVGLCRSVLNSWVCLLPLPLPGPRGKDERAPLESGLKTTIRDYTNRFFLLAKPNRELRSLDSKSCPRSTSRQRSTSTIHSLAHFQAKNHPKLTQTSIRKFPFADLLEGWQGN